MAAIGGAGLRAALAEAPLLMLLACSNPMPADRAPAENPASQPLLAPTPTTADTPSFPAVAPLLCRSRGPTPAQTEGPFFKPGAPQRQSLLEAGMPGTRLVLQGWVLDRRCRPVAGARLDFWQTDAQGEYDNAGFRLRGHQFTGDAGQYRLETVVPGEYPGRTAHIHVKVTPLNGPALTTQLYFPGASGNASDVMFDPPLVLSLEETPQGKSARFDFVP